ncbi:MAG: GntR family transcriptional regulator [Erysipelotrichaceae bacterium]|nr:GntR family transcriptional regulator [Erysipelotrichaceae bacterium]
MFVVNLQGKEAIFEQIKTQILKFIEIGVLAPNDKLPSVRTLATELGINPNTVQKAYQELEKEGVIYTLNKKGAFVSDKLDTASIKNNALEQLTQHVTNAKELGVTKEEVISLIERIYQ